MLLGHISVVFSCYIASRIEYLGIIFETASLSIGINFTAISSSFFILYQGMTTHIFSFADPFMSGNYEKLQMNLMNEIDEKEGRGGYPLGYFTD